jgi:cation transport ATPase
VAFLPVTPIAGRLRPDVGVGVGQESDVAVNDAAVTVGFGQSRNRAHVSGKSRPTSRVIQAMSLALAVVTAVSTIAVTRSGWVWA